MASGSPKLQPWDRRPWPKAGDADKDSLYRSVGKALSAWEAIEAQLSYLFTQFIYPGRDSLASRRAYGAVRTFEGRLDMLRAAADVYFAYFPDKSLRTSFKSLAGRAKNYAGRRNDIAHGIVARWHPNPMTSFMVEQETWCLLPSYIMTKHRDISETPEYAMASDDMDYFTSQFNLLLEPAYEVTIAVRYSKHPS